MVDSLFFRCVVQLSKRFAFHERQDSPSCDVLRFPLRATRISLLLCLVFGCGEASKPGTASAAPLSVLVPQRVNATIQRQARRLVHLQTERETFVVTPEHPFATPDSRWVAAGSLSPGDLVLSARSGAIRVSAAREVTLLRPVPVFNLSVAHSHAYLVGTNRVLVHNIGCLGKGKDKEDEDAQYARKREALLGELESLWRRPHKSEHHGRKILRQIAKRETKLKQLEAWHTVGLRIAIAENRREEAKLREAMRQLRHSGEDAQDVDAPRAQLLATRSALLEQLARKRVHELGRGTLPGTGWFHGAGEDLDESSLQAIQRELAKRRLSPTRVAELERLLASSEPIDNEYLAALWREIAAADAGANHDRPPPGDQDSAIRPNFRRLQEELRQERLALETQDRYFSRALELLRELEQSPDGYEADALVGEYFRLSEERRTLWRQRLSFLDRCLNERQSRLEAWRNRTPRDGLAEAELEREIALIERERRTFSHLFERNGG